jgi:protein-S-isoprenylcysteine O-methyltransferase Ste14
MSLSTLWQIVSFGWLASEIYIAIATRTRHGGGKVSDRGTFILLWVVIASSITAGSWFAETHEPNFPEAIRWLKPASILILVAGLVMRWASVLMLGKSFSSNVAIHASQTIFKNGLYRWIRHPSYTGLLLCLLATGLHTRNWISLFIMIVPTSVALLYRIHVEETALREAFGQEYIEYSRQTSRLIPGIY